MNASSHAVLLFALLLPEMSPASEAQQLLHADRTRIVSLCGTLRSEIRWGPPNFGENPKTDSHFTVWLLALDESARVTFGSDLGRQETTANISAIQLSVDPRTAQAELGPLLGKRIHAQGILESGVTQGDVTPVILANAKVDSLARRARCRPLRVRESSTPTASVLVWRCPVVRRRAHGGGGLLRQ